jgi:hypothetical protein
MTINDLEKELKEIDADLSIKENPNNAGMAGVYYKGQFLLACPSKNIYPEPNDTYGIASPSGVFVRHRTSEEVKNLVKAQLARIKTDKDYHDAFFGEGEYK